MAGTRRKSISLRTAVPGPKSVALMQRRRAAVARGPFHTTPVFADHAHGALITDVDGNVFIDLASGIGVTNTGHTPDALVKAISSQSKRLIHGSFNTTPYEGYVALCERLNEKAPGRHPKKSFLANSGAEAVDNAVKVARHYTGRAGILSFEHAFHGRTFMGMSLTYKEKPYKAGFGPFNPAVYRAPFPYAYHGVTADAAFEAFEKTAAPVASKLAAVILEPVQGEGGFLPAPKTWLARVAQWCAKHAVLVIADEIQSGFGRTGTFYASEQLGLVPDLLLSAKGLGGGMPISAVTGRAEVMDSPVEGGIGGTFGGNPVACASALAVLDLFEDKTLLRRSSALGEAVLERMSGWKRDFSFVGDVRGLGPMLAVEFVENGDPMKPSPDRAKALVKYAYEHGVILLTAGSYGNCVRLLFPLVITDAQLDEALGVLEAGLASLPA